MVERWPSRGFRQRLSLCPRPSDRKSNKSGNTVTQWLLCSDVTWPSCTPPPSPPGSLTTPTSVSLLVGVLRCQMLPLWQSIAPKEAFTMFFLMRRSPWTGASGRHTECKDWTKHSNRWSDWIRSLRFSFATDIARGVSYLHQHKICHSRLKSLNCVVDDRWVCKITGETNVGWTPEQNSVDSFSVTHLRGQTESDWKTVQKFLHLHIFSKM